jgi:heptosyltransferase-2
MHFLIIKFGALGDVVRTSYFAKALKEKYGDSLRISWLTSNESYSLIRFNPFIDDLWTDFCQASYFKFDHIFSLDDELEILNNLNLLKTKKITGAYLDSYGKPSYTEDSSSWFDMGLLSIFGKQKADYLKKINTYGHMEIFAKIFNVKNVEPNFYGNKIYESWASNIIKQNFINIGINPFAGKRWPSKEINIKELKLLILKILNLSIDRPINIILLGAGEDYYKNKKIANSIKNKSLLVMHTDEYVLKIAAVVKFLNYLISSDSLAMHLAIAQHVPTLCFFSPTSANEVDNFSYVKKVISTSIDYCSYEKNADNSSITADRLFEAFKEHVSLLGIIK